MRTLPRNIHTRETGGGRPPHPIFLYAAYTLLPLIRSPLGYEIVYPLRVFLAGLLLAAAGFMVGAVAPVAERGNVFFYAFIVLSFIAACVAFAKRAHGQRTGAEVHTQEAGWSFLAYHTEISPGLCEQVIIPLALLAVGYGVAHTFSFELGYWWMLAGLSYALMSRWEYRTRMARIRTPVDDMIRAQVFAQTIDTHEAQAKRAGGPAAAAAAAAAAPGGGRSGSAEPFEATLGRHPRRKPEPAEQSADAPDAASWGRNTNSVAPDVMTWFRRRRR